MASSEEYFNYVIDQLSLLEDISLKKMMGEYILYYRGKIFGGVYDNRFLIKITESSREMLNDPSTEIPYEGAKQMFLVENIDNKEFLKKLIDEMYSELPEKREKNKNLMICLFIDSI